MGKTPFTVLAMDMNFLSDPNVKIAVNRFSVKINLSNFCLGPVIKNPIKLDQTRINSHLPGNLYSKLCDVEVFLNLMAL